MFRVNSLLAAAMAAALSTLPVAAQAPALSGNGCTPQLVVTGDGCVGGTLDFKLTSTPGCGACILLSDNAGPVTFAGQQLPIGVPMISLFDGIVPASGCVGLWLYIPPDMALVGVELFYFSFGFDVTPPPVIEPGPAGSFTICAKPSSSGGGSDDDDDGN